MEKGGPMWDVFDEKSWQIHLWPRKNRCQIEQLKLTWKPQSRGTDRDRTTGNGSNESEIKEVVGVHLKSRERGWRAICINRVDVIIPSDDLCIRCPLIGLLQSFLEMTYFNSHCVCLSEKILGTLVFQRRVTRKLSYRVFQGTRRIFQGCHKKNIHVINASS